MMYKTAFKLTFTTGLLALLAGCGDDYTKNADQGSSSPSGKSQDAEANPPPATEDEGHDDPQAEENPGYEDSVIPDSSGNGAISGITWQDLLGRLGGIFNGGNSSNNGGTGNGGQAGTTPSTPSTPATPIPPAPEPSSDECIDADEFICAIEVAITYHTNKLRSASSPLTHHARLSYVARDWSKKQMQRGSIGHQGFPSSRNQVYAAAFPGDKITLQAENVAYASGRSGEAEAIAQMFVNMWANSAGHRRNMLGNYRIIGVGITKNGNSYYATQLFGKE